jgi:hypothetical protein
MPENSYVYIECHSPIAGEYVNPNGLIFKVITVNPINSTINGNNKEYTKIIQDNILVTTSLMHSISWTSCGYIDYPDSFKSIKELACSQNTDILVMNGTKDYYFLTSDITMLSPTTYRFGATYTNLYLRYFPECTSFVGCSNSNIIRSYDGINWYTSATVLSGTSNIVRADDNYICVGTSSSNIAVSKNLTNWITMSFGTVSRWNSCDFSFDNTQAICISATTQDTYNILVSSAGTPFTSLGSEISWMTGRCGTGYYLSEVRYCGGTINKFVVCGGMNRGFIGHSSNGISWTEITIGTNPFSRIGYSNQFDCVMITGRYIYAISNDLTTWITGIHPYSSPGLCQFIPKYESFFLSDTGNTNQTALIRSYDYKNLFIDTYSGNIIKDTYLLGKNITIGDKSNKIDIGDFKTQITIGGNLFNNPVLCNMWCENMAITQGVSTTIAWNVTDGIFVNCPVRGFDSTYTDSDGSFIGYYPNSNITAMTQTVLNTRRFYAPLNGIYHVDANCYTVSASADSILQIHSNSQRRPAISGWTVTSTDLVTYGRLRSTASQIGRITVSASLYLKKGAWVEIRGQNIQVNATDHAYVSICKFF